jgi:glycosyltransferase involved in cell wall biosynthesis
VDKVWRPEHDVKVEHQVAVVMTTFLRDEIIMKTMNFYLKFPYKMYVVDQGLPTPEKDAFYASMRAKGHVIQYAPYDCGLSACRNIAVKMVTEPYIILHDDDQQIRYEVGPQIALLERCPNVGIVGGQMLNHVSGTMQTYSFRMNIQNKVLYYTKVEHGYCDVVLNFLVARTELFKDIQWDTILKLNEHTDFFLRLKQTKWDVYYDSNFLGEHFPVRPGEYGKMRSRLEFLEYFKKKHKIDKYVGN